MMMVPLTPLTDLRLITGYWKTHHVLSEIMLTVDQGVVLMWTSQQLMSDKLFRIGTRGCSKCSMDPAVAQLLLAVSKMLMLFHVP